MENTQKGLISRARSNRYGCMDGCGRIQKRKLLRQGIKL
jgi:hypothetical protein